MKPSPSSVRRSILSLAHPVTAAAADRDLTESLKLQLVKLGDEIKSNQERLRDLNRKGRPAFLSPREMLNQKTATDPTQPTLNKVTPEQFTKLIDLQVQCDLDYLEALAQLEAARAVRERNFDKIHQEMEARARRSSERTPRLSRSWIRSKSPGS